MSPAAPLLRSPWTPQKRRCSYRTCGPRHPANDRVGRRPDSNLPVQGRGRDSQHRRGDVDPFEYTAWLNCIEPESRRKLVAQLQSDGSYLLHYGPVLNPVKDDHSTGRIDTSRSWYSTGNPEPPGVKWEYREIEIADGKLRLIPSFRCLQVFGEWWVVDTDGEKRAYQQIAAFDYADNPNHDLGTV